MAGALVMPDAEELVIAHLTGHPLLVGFAGLRVSADLYEDRPALRVRRAGGTPRDRRRLDTPLIDLEAWSSSRTVAHDLIQAARTAVVQMENTRFPTGAVGGVRDEMGARWLPDPTTDEPRWICSLSLSVSPLIP